MKIDRKKKFAAIVVLVLTLLATMVRVIIFPEIPIWKQIGIWFVSIFILSFFVSIFFLINALFDKILPYEKSIKWRMILQILLSIVIIFTLRSIFFAIAPRFAPAEIQNLDFTIQKVFITSVYVIDLVVCFAVNLAFYADHFFFEWMRSMQRAERLEREKTQVQYDNLKNQLNPHFLFNAFTSLNTLISENQELASQFLKHLSRLYRHLLENKEIVTLKKELEFLKNFLFLVKTRYNDMVNISIDVKEETREYLIVPITLQNLVENALKHNIVNSENPLHIRIYTEEDFICVENNIQRKNIVEGSNKQGLDNLQKLYHYLSPKGIEIREAENIFVVKVPLIKE